MVLLDLFWRLSIDARILVACIKNDTECISIYSSIHLRKLMMNFHANARLYRVALPETALAEMALAESRSGNYNQPSGQLIPNCPPYAITSTNFAWGGDFRYYFG